MNRSISLLSLCLLYTTLLSGQTPLRFLEVDLNEVREQAGRDGRLYLAYFAADWCVPCQWMEKETFQNSRLTEYVEQHYLPVKIDIDKRSSRPLQEQYEVNMLPSILLFSAQGQLLTRIETALSSQDLLDILQEYNQPGNRIAGQISTAVSSEPILDSPKPVIRVYRPPLQTETSTPAAEAPLPPPVMIESPTKTYHNYNASAYGTSNNTVTLAPRSERAYRIQIGVFDNYQKAIRKVEQLEETFEEPVQLLASKGSSTGQTYRIFIGHFSKKQAAESFLYYLRRKNMDGEIVDEER